MSTNDFLLLHHDTHTRHTLHDEIRLTILGNVSRLLRCIAGKLGRDRRQLDDLSLVARDFEAEVRMRGVRCEGFEGVFERGDEMYMEIWSGTELVYLYSIATWCAFPSYFTGKSTHYYAD